MTSSIQTPQERIKYTLEKGTPSEKRALFAFDKNNTIDQVLFKLNLWMREFFPQYFSSKDAPFHREIDRLNLMVYRGELDQFVDAAFKGAAKTARTKLMFAFATLNDIDHFRRFIRVLAEDGANSTQIVTDIFNMLVSPKVSAFYPEVFAKTDAKREETMSSFTTATGVKIVAKTVYGSQRGALQEDARPDMLWFEDFENRKTLWSVKKTIAIAQNMEEARTGLAKGGGCIYTCNYISEMGNVHTLITKDAPGKRVLVTPIMVNGIPTWSRYSSWDIERMKAVDEDFEGERMCKPSASKDLLFDREVLEAMQSLEPIRDVAGFKIFAKYDPSHRYGSGHDVAGGVRLDSSTSVFIDFETVPARVVATFASNEVSPESFGDEIQKEGDHFGSPIAGIESNNHGHTTIARARQLEVKLYKRDQDETRIQQNLPIRYGWETNALTKPKMLSALVKAVNDGLLQLSDKNLIAECKSYTRNDLIDKEGDVRVTTRHFDLLMGAAIAWQMKDDAKVASPKSPVNDFLEEPAPMMYPDIGI